MSLFVIPNKNKYIRNETNTDTVHKMVKFSPLSTSSNPHLLNVQCYIKRKKILVQKFTSVNALLEFETLLEDKMPSYELKGKFTVSQNGARLYFS